MSKSDEILNRLVALTVANGGFAKTWKRVGFDAFQFSVTGHVFTEVWANSVLQLVLPGADIDELYPSSRKVAKPASQAVASQALAPPAPRPAGKLTDRQHRSIIEADAAAEGRRRVRR